MEVLENPEICNRTSIQKDEKENGYIQMVMYTNNNDLPHIEYAITDDRYKNKGIMSKALPEYIKLHKESNPQMIALVKKDNLISIKLIEKNGFVRMKEDEEGIYWYIAHFGYSKEFLEGVMKNFKEKRNV